MLTLYYSILFKKMYHTFGWFFHKPNFYLTYYLQDYKTSVIGKKKGNNDNLIYFYYTFPNTKYRNTQCHVYQEERQLEVSYIELYEEWVEYVNTPIREGELHNIRNSVNRQAPLGNEKWKVETATKYGMLSTLNERERPRNDI